MRCSEEERPSDWAMRGRGDLSARPMDGSCDKLAEMDEVFRLLKRRNAPPARATKKPRPPQTAPATKPAGGQGASGEVLIGGLGSPTGAQVIVSFTSSEPDRCSDTEPL